MGLLGKIVLGGVNWWAGRLKKKADSRTAEYRNHIAGVRRKAPALTIKLVALPEPSWLREHPAAIQGAATLTQRGFVPVGCYTIVGTPKWQAAGFVNPRQSASATLVMLGEQMSISLGSFFTDGSLFTVTDMSARPGQVFPPWFERHRLSGLTVGELVDRFFEMRPARACRLPDAETFAAREEEAFHKLRAWSADRGGATREELAEQLKAAGKLPAGTEAGPFLVQSRLHEIEKAIWNWLQLQPELPFPLADAIEWMAIVHDELPAEDLANTYWCYSGDFSVRAPEFAGGSPRDVFARVNANRGHRLQRVWIKETGLPVDIYLPAD